MTEILKEEIAEAYEEVRNDSSPTTWALLTYDESCTIRLGETGSDYADFIKKLNDDERFFGFIRMTTGEDPCFKSKRAKFVLITWIGANVGSLKRAKVSTDKSFVKAVLQNYAIEIQTSDVSEVQEAYVKDLLMRAGGANYGTGTRDD